MTTPSTSAQGPVALDAVIAAIEDQMPATQDMESTMICEALERAIVAVRSLGERSDEDDEDPDLLYDQPLEAVVNTAASPASPSGVREAAIDLLSHLKLYVAEKLEGVDADMLHDRMYDLTASLASAATPAPTDEVVAALLAEKPFVFDPATNFAHADDGGAPEHGILWAPVERAAPTSGSEDGEGSLAQRNLQDGWAAMTMIREAVETLGPIGAMPASEHLVGPTFLHEADAIVAGIIALAKPASEPAGGDVRLRVANIIRAEIMSRCTVDGDREIAGSEKASYTAADRVIAALSSSAAPAEPDGEPDRWMWMHPIYTGGEWNICDSSSARRTEGASYRPFYAHPAPATVEMREAFIAGWWINAATPGEDGAGDQAYFDGCAEVDWQEYVAALAPATEGRKG